MDTLRTAFRSTTRLLGETGRGYLDDRGPQLAAAIAYYALFAVFPLTILLVAIFGLISSEGAARREVTDFVLQNVPLTEGGGRREIRGLLREVTSNAGAFGVVGIAGLLFSASGLMGSLRHAASRAFDVEERRPPLLGKLLDVVLVLAVGLAVGLSLVLTVIERLAVSVADTLRDAVGPVLAFLPQIVLALGQLTPVVLAAIVFAFLYRLLPTCDVRWRDCLPAAAFAAGLYELLKTLFAFYLENVASYGAVYGSLATIIAFAFFVFLSANIYLLGAEMAAVWPRLRGLPLDDTPAPPLRVRLRNLVRSATGH